MACVDGDVGLVSRPLARFAHGRGKITHAHNPRPEPLRNFGRAHEAAVDEARLALVELFGCTPQHEQIPFYFLPCGGAGQPCNTPRMEGQEVNRGTLGKITRPAQGTAQMGFVEGVKNERESVDGRFFGLQIAQPRLPIEFGQEVEVGVLVERGGGVGAQGGQTRLEGGGAVLGKFALGGERGQGGDENGDPSRF